MALVKKPQSSPSMGNEKNIDPSIAKEAEIQRKRARTLAKQQQASERIAAATGQLSSGITEAAAASEQLKSASDQIAVTSQETTGAAQESLAAFMQVNQSIALQLKSAEDSSQRCDELIKIARHTSDLSLIHI